MDEKPGLQLSFRCPHLNALVMCPNPPPSEEQIGSSLRRVFLAVDVSAARDGTELIPLISATVGSDSAASDSHGLGCEAKLGVANLSLHLAVQAHGSPGEECVDSVKIMEAPSVRGSSSFIRKGLCFGVSFVTFAPCRVLLGN